MRLIDLDEILISVKGGRHKNKTLMFDALISLFANVPTVEAIPISWLKEYAKKASELDAMVIVHMVEEWAERKEE